MAEEMRPADRGERPLRLAILVGGGGSALQALLDAERAGTLPATVAVVVSHRADAGGLCRALDAGVAAVYLPAPAGRRRAGAEMDLFEDRLAGVLRPFAPDLVILAGWMRILSARFLDAFPRAVLNLHPALLPPDGGDTVALRDGRRIPALRGAHAVADALAAGLDTTGATIHYAVPEVDRGPVLCGAETPILPGDSVDTLHARIKTIEHRLLLETVAALWRGDADAAGPVIVGRVPRL